MKTTTMLLTAIALFALGNSPGYGADTMDQAHQKLVAGSNKPQPSGPPKANFANALIGDDNSIQLSAWGRNLIIPSDTPFNSNKYTLLSFTEPTAVRTITFPNASGTIQVSAALDAAGAVTLGASIITFEGATANAFESIYAVVDPTADGTVWMPDIALTGVNGDANMSYVLSTIDSGLNGPGQATSAWAATGPATYYILLQNDNTGNRFRTHAGGDFGASVKTAETLGAFTTVTPPTTFTASKGPIASLY